MGRVRLEAVVLTNVSGRGTARPEAKAENAKNHVYMLAGDMSLISRIVLIYGDLCVCADVG